jgi:methionyl aminopeptidase|nr:MAG: methionine aminopeptidase [Bacteroidota bacterium]
MIALKSEWEIERIRAACELVGRTLAEVARHIAPGVRTRELDAVAEAYIREHGGKPAFKGYQVGGRRFPATLCVSVNEEVVHGIPGDRVLAYGDLVSIDCGVLLEGYYGDSAYTFVVGDTSPENRRLIQVTYEALYRGIEQAVPGHTVGHIGAAIQAHVEANGFQVVRDLVGHGVGRHLHEDPPVPNYGRPGQGPRLMPGMTLAIEPMVNRGTWKVRTRKDGWTIVTADGSPSAHFEHVIVVRNEGAEILTTFAYITQLLAPESLPYGQAAGH